MPFQQKNHLLLLTIFTILFPPILQAQGQDSLPGSRLTFQEIIKVNRPLSYVTFGEGFGNLEPLLFEAQVASSFFISSKKGQWALQFSPHIVLRMKRKKSLPVNNPSYIAPLYFHHHLEFWENSFLHKLLYKKAYATMGLHHHSNGQGGPFFNDDGSINVENGSFSTNYASLALTLYDGKGRKSLPAFSLLQFYYEHHITWLDVENVPFPNALEGLYGTQRLMLKYSNLDLSKKDEEIPSKFLANSRIISQTGWIFGPMGKAAADDLKERLLFSLKYLYYPSWLNEIALFAEFYRGQDYYNIRLERNLAVFRIGLISDPLNLGAATDVFNRNNKSSKN